MIDVKMRRERTAALPAATGRNHCGDPALPAGEASPHL
jgi:hypothetical protein